MGRSSWRLRNAPLTRLRLQVVLPSRLDDIKELAKSGSHRETHRFFFMALLCILQLENILEKKQGAFATVFRPIGLVDV